MAKPIEKNNPILTVRLASVERDRPLGPDVEFCLKIQEHGAKMHMAWIGQKDVWLYQLPRAVHRPFSRIRFQLRENTPFFAEGQREQFSRIPLHGHLELPLEGRHRTHKVPVRAFEGPEADDCVGNIYLELEWFLTANIMDVIHYACEEMANHAYGYTAKMLRILREAGKCAAPDHLQKTMGIPPLLVPTKSLKTLFRALSTAYLAYLIRPGGPWNQSQLIQDAFGDWSLDAERGMSYYFDIWSDIHLGYLGASIGFSQKSLLDDGGLNEAIPGLLDLGLLSVVDALADGDYLQGIASLEANHPLKMQLLALDERIRKGIRIGDALPHDQAALRLGTNLWNTYGRRVAQVPADVLTKLRRARVAKMEAPEGVPPAKFLVAGNKF